MHWAALSSENKNERKAFSGWWKKMIHVEYSPVPVYFLSHLECYPEVYRYPSVFRSRVFSAPAKKNPAPSPPAPAQKTGRKKTKYSHIDRQQGLSCISAPVASFKNGSTNKNMLQPARLPILNSDECPQFFKLYFYLKQLSTWKWHPWSSRQRKALRLRCSYWFPYSKV